MSEATFTIRQVDNGQWGLRRETANGCGVVLDATWDEPMGALLHASSRAGEYFPCRVEIPKQYLPAVLESLNDKNYDAWLASEYHDDYVGAD
jgi:hypothetical protein